MGATVLDAYAGTGALGIEALSRGAGSASFFEKEPEYLPIIRQNIQRYSHEARLYPVAIEKAPQANSPVDIAFFDPPYGLEDLMPTLAQLAQKGWLNRESLCVYEFDAKREKSQDQLPQALKACSENLSVQHQLKTGRNGFIFFYYSS